MARGSTLGGAPDDGGPGLHRSVGVVAGTGLIDSPAIGSDPIVLTGHTGTVTGCSFSPDGTLLATTSGDWDKTVRLWDPHGGTLVRVLDAHADWVTGCAFSADGATLITWSGTWTVRAWDPATGREHPERWVRRHLPAVTAPGVGRGFALSPDGSLLVVTGGGWDNKAQVLDATTGAVMRSLEGHTAWVHGCAFSPDGALVATASGDHTACLWDPTTGSLVRRFVGHESWVTSCAFSPDATLLATTSADYTARLWPIDEVRLNERLVPRS